MFQQVVPLLQSGTTGSGKQQQECQPYSPKREETVRRQVAKSAAAVAADYDLRVCTVRKWKYRYAVAGNGHLPRSVPDKTVSMRPDK